MSFLPQPSLRHQVSHGRALSDLTDSEDNARTAMPPPLTTTSGIKRQGSNCALRSISLQVLGLRLSVPEPASKRKPKTISQLSRPASVASHDLPNSLTSYRSNSNASTLSRSTSVTSRNTSNTSYTGSINSSIRPPMKAPNTMRPKSSYGNDRFGTTTKSNRSLLDLQSSHEMNTTKSKAPFHSRMFGPKSMMDLSQTGRTRTKTASMQSLRSEAPIRLPSVVVNMRDKARQISLSTQLAGLNLHDTKASNDLPETPAKKSSRIPRSPIVRAPDLDSSVLVTPKLRRKAPMKRQFLTPGTNIETFDTDEQYDNFKRMFEDYKQMHQDSMQKIDVEREKNDAYREKMTELERDRTAQTDGLISLKTENSTLRFQLETIERNIQQLKEDHEYKLEQLKREHQQDVETTKSEHRTTIQRIKDEHKQELKELRQAHQAELEQERSGRDAALTQVSTQGALEKQRQLLDMERKEQDLIKAQIDIERLEADMARERQINADLQQTIRTAGDNASSMESTRQGLQAKIAYLESDCKSQSEAYATMERRMNEAISKSDILEDKLRKEETTRRKLHNQVLELKGNIRVFCRVRPTLTAEEDLARMKYPDPEEATDIEVRGVDEKNSLGKDVTKQHPFSFDRVFDPAATNDNVFGEISQLIQSALDGYNVCIFAYGQTGSGKTYTMSSADGMIPRALRQIYSTSKDLADRGWTYSMEGSFIEVYNEELRDLLSDDKESKKHDIHHDLDTQETTVSNLTTLHLDNEEQVESILTQAMSRRSVAATKVNEHSSRSHSVFILKLVGNNSITGEKCKGTLNLVDLAGSERIKNAETSGQRLKETQSINKSLSCLGDVIGALGQGPVDTRSSLNTRDSLSHIPYRNSKLTYLLQLSLGGNCKTLMFVMVTPEKKCLSETITSLKFAEKVSRTRVGVAKKTK